MTFTSRHVNRITFPQRWALVVEDDIEWQGKFLKFLSERFGPQGDFLVSAAPSGIFAGWQIQHVFPPTFILLDHDLPYGNGPEIMQHLRSVSCSAPVCAVSGIPANNERLMSLGAKATARKDDWVALDAFLKSINL